MCFAFLRAWVLVLMGKYCWGLAILGNEETCTHEIYWGSGTAIYFSVMGYLLMCSDSSCAYILVVITLLLPAALLTYILTGYAVCGWSVEDLGIGEM